MNWRWKTAQYFEARWWKSYLSGRASGTYLEWKRAYWRSFLNKGRINILPGEKILDAGCGPAGIFILLPQCEVVAIDPLLDTYQEKLPHFKKENYPQVYFENIPLEYFDRKNYFEKVFCLNAINHVAELDRCVANLCRSLKKNGVLYLSVDAHNFSFLKNIFRIIPGDILHPHQLGLTEYVERVKNNGLEIQKIDLIKKGFIFNYYLITANKT